MEIKFKNLCVFIACMFLLGNSLIYLGIAKGADIASTLSRPPGANSWSTSGEFINAMTYVPVIAGVFLLILSLILATLAFIKFVKIK